VFSLVKCCADRLASLSPAARRSTLVLAVSAVGAVVSHQSTKVALGGVQDVTRLIPTLAESAKARRWAFVSA
jgi:hypothetical protein